MLVITKPKQNKKKQHLLYENIQENNKALKIHQIDANEI